ncbi:uncharacterized protein EI97DRAFT_435138 [Westerdykella ornata]|uniref:Uncharacterized protein n=1 Tax=Westerdykella ornata TaxID=318751 RepID=A0A6A6JG51_WESOR|nr:uncharacterized protein EI97DRAFT_435138 [Westerdykella ornata]KAF2274606.1 hypothetical protein EI97DRAFT_435138 [Westerdykella ornata]
MIYPQGCYCMNDEKLRCWEQCGGPKPTLASCPPISPPQTLSTLTTTKQPPTPTPTNPICGGGRAGYHECPSGLTCIKDPRDPGCGPACDGLGICVEDKMCGGFAGLPCNDGRKVCMDDPRDGCDPQKGGADCGGVCVFPDKGPYGEW